MYTQRQIIDMALELPGATADTPFEGDFYSTVLRHGDTGKWFGIALKAPRSMVGLAGDGHAEVLDLKCDPLVSFGLMQSYPDIVPAYHMNKHHWIAIRLEGDVPEDVVRMLLEMSFSLTQGKRSQRSGRAGDSRC